MVYSVRSLPPFGDTLNAGTNTVSVDLISFYEHIERIANRVNTEGRLNAVILRTALYNFCYTSSICIASTRLQRYLQLEELH